MKEALQDNHKDILRKVLVTAKHPPKSRQYICLAGKIFDIGEIGGKIHVYF